MIPPQPVLVRNARVIDPATGRDGPGAVLFQSGETLDQGVILEVAERIDVGPEVEVIDAGGRTLMPGLVDLRVVSGEPGAEHKETFKSAGRAAAAGGVTTLVVMPNTNPIIDDVSLVDFVLRRASARTGVRILPAAALTRGLDGALMTEMGLLLEAGAVMFSNGDRAVSDSRVMRRAMAYATAFDALVAHRPEDPFLAAGGVMHEGELSARMGLGGIPSAAEVIMAERDLALAELTGARLLLDMVSARATLEALRRARARGARVHASVSVHHLALNEMDVAGYRTFAKLSPPLRSEDDRLALAQAVADGLIDAIVSGHDPRPAEEKRLPFEEAAFGAAALETLLPGALSLHHNGLAPLGAVVRALTLAPADLLRLPQGRLKPGAPADMILVDLDAPYQLDADALRSKSRNSPFDGKLLQGRVERTFVAGRTVFDAAVPAVRAP